MSSIKHLESIIDKFDSKAKSDEKFFVLLVEEYGLDTAWQDIYDILLTIYTTKDADEVFRKMVIKFHQLRYAGKVHTYKITLKHDSGSTSITTTASSKMQAEKKVVLYELAPESAIVKIERIS